MIEEKMYESPLVDILEVEVESGFAMSGESGIEDYEPGEFEW